MGLVNVALKLTGDKAFKELGPIMKRTIPATREAVDKFIKGTGKKTLKPGEHASNSQRARKEDVSKALTKIKGKTPAGQAQGLSLSNYTGILPNTFGEVKAGTSFKIGNLDLSFGQELHQTLNTAESMRTSILPSHLMQEFREFLKTGKGGMRIIPSGENSGKIVGIQIGEKEARIITPAGEVTGRIQPHAFIRHDLASNTDIYGKKIQFDKLIMY